MSDPITVTWRVRVPAQAISVRAARSSGHGGQNVNKVETKIDLRVDLSAVQGLSEAARVRLEVLARHRRDGAGRLLVISQRSRHQARNLEDAREKVRALVLQALKPIAPRRPTRPSANAVERRIAEKKRRGTRKRERRVADD